MIVEMVPIRSVKNYFREFIVDGIGKGAKQDIVKSQLLDAFRKEIFGQIAFKYGKEAENYSKENLANLDGIQNILRNSFRKWRRLCILCKDAGLRNFIQLEDLKKTLEDFDDGTEEGEDAHVLGLAEEQGSGAEGDSEAV